MKLLFITESPLSKKKWRATFEHDGHGSGLGKTQFHTDFGATGYKDFTQGASPERATLYRLRHEKDLETDNPTRAGFLSYYILWASPNFDANVRKYKNKFHL
jgi:hypothetical protein